MKWTCLLALAIACGGTRAPEPMREPIATPAAPAPVPVEEIVLAEPGPSIYDLPVALRDASGHAIGLDIARGHPVLISMFYASCSVACPVMLDAIAQTAAELPPAIRDDLRIVFVSFDAARDTPEQLRELARARGLDQRWILAAAGESDARALAALIDFTYRKLDNGEYFHGSTIVALDREGRPIARADNLAKRASLTAALRAQAHGQD